MIRDLSWREHLPLFRPWWWWINPWLYALRRETAYADALDSLDVERGERIAQMQRVAQMAHTASQRAVPADRWAKRGHVETPPRQ